jgi:PKD repeat protein/glucose/arabinose dehydrogenase/type 1 glutamine amidotransferase
MGMHGGRTTGLRAPGAGRRSLARAFVACLALAAAIGLTAAGAAQAQSGENVLVFHGPADETTTPGVDAIEAIGAANDFTVTATSDAGQLTAANLADYRAVVFLNTAGNLLGSAQESAVQTFVQGGGGFLAIGSAAQGEVGSAAFDQLIGARPAADSPTGVSEQTVAYGDRVHPATRELPLTQTRSDAWYRWETRPTGSVHTVARYHATDAPAGDGTNEGGTDHPISWCRDRQNGRTFYLGMGRTAASYGEENFGKHLEGALVWTAGLIRGNCKATIMSNYQADRIVNGGATSTGLQFSGESHGLATAENGWVLYIGRGDCRTDAERGALLDLPALGRILDHSNENVGMGCGNIHVWDPEAATPGEVNSGITRAATLAVYADGGTGSERTNEGNHKMEYGLLGVTPAPDFTESGHVYVQYFPSFNPESSPPGLGIERRISKMSRPRISRFTMDMDTKQIDLSSEVRIFEYDAQVFSCCHVGGGMGFDSEGNLYVTTGDTNSSQGTGGYSGNNQPPKCPTGPADEASSAHCGTAGYSYQDARRTAGNTNDYNGKMLRFRPRDIPEGEQPAVGVGTTYELPTEESPNGANLFDGTEGGGDKAKPEIYAMGLRNPSRLAIDPETDIPYSAWVGPDAGSPSATLGPSTYESAAQLDRAGNYGWPYCMGNGQAYRDRVADGSERTTNGTGFVDGGPATGGTAGWYDCDNIVNDSTNNTGLTELPHSTGTGKDAGKMRRHNIWWSRGTGADGCPTYPRDRGAGNAPNYGAPATALCPWVQSRGLTVMNGPVYRYDEEAEDTSRRWPEYWDGRWFLHNNGGDSIKHGVVLDPATDQDGGQPVYADSLRSFSWPGSYMDSKFGADGALYVQTYDGFFRAGPNVGITRFSYTGGGNTPAANPTAQLVASRTVQFSSAGSGGVELEWDFGDGETSGEANPRHVYDETGTYDVELTVTYADGETNTKTIPVEVVITSDDIAPVTTHTLGGAQDAGGNYTGPVDVTLKATDEGGSGLGTTEYRVDGGAWQVYDTVPEAETIFDGTQESRDGWAMTKGGNGQQQGDFEVLGDGSEAMRTVGGLGMLWYKGREYGDFSLKFEWREARTDNGWSNGGAFVRFPNPETTAALPANDPGRFPCDKNTTDQAWVAIYCGHEIQAHDNPGGGEPQKTGSVYNFAPRDIGQARPVPKGDWTKYEIRVVGQQYTIIRDGQVLNEFDNSIPKESSRDGDPPTEQRQFTKGYIGLQNHGSSDLLDYRRVSVLDLDEGARVGTGPFQVAGNGSHVVEYRSRDLGGNVEEKKVVTFRIGPDAGPGPGESGTTPPPTGSGTNPPVIDTPASFTLRKVSSRMKARSLAKRGLKVTVACTGGLRGTAKLTVAGKARKQLGRKTLARRSVACFGQETTSVRLKVSKKVAKKLRKAKKSIKATLSVSMGEPGAKAIATKRTIRLTR